MGRLIDAVLAVSALAIASAVAWADWLMSCYGVGVGSEAMSQVLVDQVLIMVRLRKNRRGVGYKNGCISGTLSLICFRIRHNVAGGVPYH